MNLQVYFVLENLFICNSLSGIEERLALPRQPVHLAEARETETVGGRGGAGGVGPPGNRRKARQLEVSELPCLMEELCVPCSTSFDKYS